jgi:hypothetical protein
MEKIVSQFFAFVRVRYALPCAGAFPGSPASTLVIAIDPESTTTQ